MNCIIVPPGNTLLDINFHTLFKNETDYPVTYDYDTGVIIVNNTKPQPEDQRQSLKNDYSYLYTKFSEAGLKEEDVIKALEVIDNTCNYCFEKDTTHYSCYCHPSWDK